jgi:hypothetical protein
MLDFADCQPSREHNNKEQRYSEIKKKDEKKIMNVAGGAWSGVKIGSVAWSGWTKSWENRRALMSIDNLQQVKDELCHGELKVGFPVS